MQEIKLWNIYGDNVTQIQKDHLNYENRLESWLIDDISILSSDLAIIGSQVVTSFGKIIDILVMNSVGELIIVELKRGKTDREVVAQTLDYATWVKGLTYEDLNTILNKHGKSVHQDIGDLFTESFDKDAENIEFNSDHKMLIVGSTIDDSTVRIIDYLSNEPYSVNINAVNFNYFKDKEGNEYLAQSFINPEINLSKESQSKKRKRAKSIISTLFEQEKLQLGQKVYLQPAIDQGCNKNDVSAEIVNKNQSCLKWNNEEELYSFSKLRRTLTDKYGLDIKKFWGFGVRYDWVTETGKNLSDLLEE